MRSFNIGRLGISAPGMWPSAHPSGSPSVSWRTMFHGIEVAVEERDSPFIECPIAANDLCELLLKRLDLRYGRELIDRFAVECPEVIDREAVQLGFERRDAVDLS